MSEGWQDDATCVRLGIPADTMQPERATPDELAVAMEVCTHCPVKRQCHDLAVSQDDPYGIHAGHWWGDPPVSPLALTCEWCGSEVETARKLQRYCRSSCKVAAWRARALTA